MGRHPSYRRTGVKRDSYGVVPKPSETISTTDFSATKDQEAKSHEDSAFPH